MCNSHIVHNYTDHSKIILLQTYSKQQTNIDSPSQGVKDSKTNKKLNNNQIPFTQTDDK